MSRYVVDIRDSSGEQVLRTVRAGSHAAAYERVRREHVEGGGDPMTELALVQRRGLRRSTRLVAAGRPGNGGDGLAGVREPRRPSPRPPGLRATRDHH